MASRRCLVYKALQHQGTGSADFAGNGQLVPGLGTLNKHLLVSASKVAKLCPA
jgi:hypothetical protein